jgi:hypothetical protein
MEKGEPTKMGKKTLFENRKLRITKSTSIMETEWPRGSRLSISNICYELGLAATGLIGGLVSRRSPVRDAR